MEKERDLDGFMIVLNAVILGNKRFQSSSRKVVVYKDEFYESGRQLSLCLSQFLIFVMCCPFLSTDFVENNVFL